MSLCINPICPKPDHPQNSNNRHCQSCGSDLLLQGRYRVMRLLSDNSGFGKIYSAEERGTPKILKVLKEHLNKEPKAVELFQQEANVLAQFQHPGIPKVDGYFPYQTRNGLILHCIVMEKIEGPNLEEWLKQQGNGDRPHNTQVLLQRIDELAQKLGKRKTNLPLGVAVGVLLVLGSGIGCSESKFGQTPVTTTQSPNVNSSIPGLTQNSDKLSLINTLKSDCGFASSVAITPDGQTLVSGCYDKTIKIWNLATGNLIRTLEGHSDWVMSVAISPDGQTLVSGSTDKTIKIWNLATGNLIRTLEGHLNPVMSVAISPDGQTLVSGSEQIKIWNLATGNLIGTLEGHSGWVRSVAISPDGQTLVSGSTDETLKIWNLATGNLIRTLEGHSDEVMSVAISPDGQTLVSGSVDQTIKIWNLATGNLIRTLEGDERSVMRSVAISPDGQTLFSVGGLTIQFWNLATGNLIGTQGGHVNGVGSVTISPNGQTLVSGSFDKTIKIWRVSR